MARLSDHNSGHERIQVLFDTGSGECRLYYMLGILELLLSADYLLPQLQKQNKTNDIISRVMVYKWGFFWI